MAIAIHAIIVVCALLPSINGHGRLIEPPSRASAWRYGFDTPHNYNDHELYCGGFSRQWSKNNGKCGVCGDPWDSKLPRAHEYGGTYGKGIIVRKYNVGSIINIRVELTANHNGYFVFALCENYKNTTQECLDKHILKATRPQESLEFNDIRYYPREGNKVYEMKYRLPKMACPHCVLQWRYIAGNNWGKCSNGTEQVGCGPQEEFRGCSDIQIGKGIATEETTSISEESSTTISPEPEPGATYSPISAIIISLVSFLVAFLIFFLLYFRYYQVGEKLKKWIKEKRSQNRNEILSPAPAPPPRARRATNNKSPPREDLHDVELNV